LKNLALNGGRREKVLGAPAYKQGGGSAIPPRSKAKARREGSRFGFALKKHGALCPHGSHQREGKKKRNGAILSFTSVIAGQRLMGNLGETKVPSPPAPRKVRDGKNRISDLHLAL